VADSGNGTIRKVTAAGVVTTLAGTAGIAGYANGTGAAAQFNDPQGVAVDSSGNLYVTDYYNQVIRKITSAGVVTTLAGAAGTAGYANGTGTAALFNGPTGVAVDAGGNVYVGDTSNEVIRRITPAGVVTTLAGAAGTVGYANGTGTAAMFSAPEGVAVDTSGNVYVADVNNDVIRKITSAGVVTTLAGAPIVTVSQTLTGTNTINNYADGVGASAIFYNPIGVAADANGNVYVADFNNYLIREITPGGVVTTLAGYAISPTIISLGNRIQGPLLAMPTAPEQSPALIIPLE